MRNTKGKFNTTESLAHFRSQHPKSSIGVQQRRKQKRKRDERDEALVSVGAVPSLGAKKV